MENPKSVMWLSDSPFTCTGYSTQSLNIMNHLSKKYKTHFMAHNFHGLTIPPGTKLADGTQLNFTMSGAGMRPYCQDIIGPRIIQNKADIFCILLDTFMLYPWFLDMNTLNAKTMFYFPSDGGGGMPRDCEKILQKVNYPVAMAKFGQKQVKDYYGIDVAHIPHGVDTKRYFSFTKEDKEKFKASKGLEGKFIVGTVARNQGRKMLDRTLKAFQLFSQENRDAVLFMHCDPYDAAAVFDLNKVIARMGLQNRVLFSGVRYFSPFDYIKMIEVYNLMDTFVLSTSGEGFGIPIIEAMACGLPQVVTDYTTTPELLVENGKCGEPVKLIGGKEQFSDAYLKNENMRDIDNRIHTGTLMGNWDVERGLMDDYDCFDKITKLYKSENLRKRYGKVGREKAEKYYDWRVVNKLWDAQFNKMLE